MSPTAIQLRPAERGDYPAVTELMRRLNLEDPGEEQREGSAGAILTLLEAEPERGGLYVAADGGTMAAYALLITYLSNEYGGLIAYLDELYVLPTYRRQGLGGRILQYLEEECLRRGFRRLVLEVLEGNDGAARFYARYGFKRQRRSVYGKDL